MSHPDQSFRPRASVEALRARAQLLQRTREFFDSRGFFEVQTPVLASDTVVDRFIEPLSVLSPRGKEGKDEKLWLQTSPEFFMKRLLASGAEAIYQIGPVFRAHEVGPLHNTEFTMLEWYRVGHDYRQGMNFLDQFGQSLLGCKPATRITYREAFIRFAAVDPLDEEPLERQLSKQARTASRIESVFGGELTVGNKDEVLNYLLTEDVEPQLAKLGSVILYDFPASQAALAKIRPDDPPVAERFEWYLDGIELANGYHELTDAGELLARNRQTNSLRRQAGRDALPEESRLLDAMRYGLPDCCGVAVGFDRLAMLVQKESEIAKVMAFSGI